MKRISALLLVFVLAITSFKLAPNGASPAGSIDLTTSNGWLCAGDTPGGNAFSNAWGFYIFDENGASVICSDKGYTNIMYKVNGVDFDKIKGLTFSAAAIGANWDIKLKKGNDSEKGYSGKWNGVNADLKYEFYDFSQYSWSGTDVLYIYLYAIGGKGGYAEFSFLELSQYDSVISEGYTINTSDYSGWCVFGKDITEPEASASNGSFCFSDTGITITCVQEDLYYFTVSKTVRNVNLDTVKGLSYNVVSPGSNRWEIKVFNETDNRNTAHASGGVWNGIAGSKTGFVDFRNTDWTGIGDLRIELYAIGNANTAEFSDLTFINLDAKNESEINVTDYSFWDVKSESLVTFAGEYSFTDDGIKIKSYLNDGNYRYAVTSKKIYTNLDLIHGLLYTVAAKNSRWLLEITNTTLDQTVQINPSWSGNYGSRSGYYDFSDIGWSGNANLTVTVYAVGLENEGSIIVRGLQLLAEQPVQIPLLSADDRSIADITGEGEVNICDLVKAQKTNIDQNGSVFDTSLIKSEILNDVFFNNPEQIYKIPENTVLEIDCTRFDNFIRSLATAVQGIVNRNGAKIYLQTGISSYLNKFDGSGYSDEAFPEGFLEKYRSGGVDAFWSDEISRIYGLNFLNVPIEAAIDIYSSSFNGIVEYDKISYDENGKEIPSVSRTNSAITAAGIYTALPVTAGLKNKYSSIRKMNTVLDLKGKFQSKIQSTNWAINNLLSESSRKFASSYFYEGENGTYQNDYAVMNKAFCYELSSVVAENIQHVGADEAAKYNPAEEALLKQILAHIEDYGFVWGWGSGGENALASVTALNGLELICANMSNGSFFAGLDTSRTDFKQPNSTSYDDVSVENKFYISFMMNEGDSFKAMANLYGGTWTENARGQLPIAWGVDSLVLDLFPFFTDYYYNNSTVNDYYFAASSGYGYLHPSFLPKDMQNDYAQKVKSGGQKYDLRYVDIWWFGMTDENGNSNKWDWLNKTGMRGLTQWSNQNKTTFEGNTPVIYSELYYPSSTIWKDVSNKEKAQLLASSLRNAQSKIPDKTFCTVIYGGEPQYFKDIADNLPKDKFEIVPLDELFIIAEKSSAELSQISVEYDFDKASAGEWDPSKNN